MGKSRSRATLTQHGVPAGDRRAPRTSNPHSILRLTPKSAPPGLWQFMPSTPPNDSCASTAWSMERLDPYSATEAAANLMLYNYRPASVPGRSRSRRNNHGPGGVCGGPQDELGHQRPSPSSSSATRARTFRLSPRGNFYVAILGGPGRSIATLRSSSAPLTRLPDTDSTPTELPDYIPIDATRQGVQGRYGRIARLESGGCAPAHLERREIRAARLCAAIGRALPRPAEITAGWARLPPTAALCSAAVTTVLIRLRRGETLAGVCRGEAGSSMKPVACGERMEAARAQWARGDTVRVPMPAHRGRKPRGIARLRRAAALALGRASDG